MFFQWTERTLLRACSIFYKLLNVDHVCKCHMLTQYDNRETLHTTGLRSMTGAASEMSTYILRSLYYKWPQCLLNTTKM